MHSLLDYAQSLLFCLRTKAVAPIINVRGSDRNKLIDNMAWSIREHLRFIVQTTSVMPYCMIIYRHIPTEN